MNAEKSRACGRKLLPQLKEAAAVSPGKAALAGTPPGRPSAVPQTRARRRRAVFPAEHRCAVTLTMSKPCSCHSPSHQKVLLRPKHFQRHSTMHKPGKAQPTDGIIATRNDRTLLSTARSHPASPWEWVPWLPVAPPRALGPASAPPGPQMG